MGAAKEKRDKAAFSLDFDRAWANNPRRSDVNEITRLENLVSLLEARNETLKSALLEASAEIKSLKDVSRKNDLEMVRLSRLIIMWRTQAHKWQGLFEGKDKGHRKLSAIVRIALSPDQYLSARALAAEEYPKLFNRPGDKSE